MNYSSNDEARYWAEKLATSEAEAFEQAIKRIKPEDRISQLERENAELRRQHVEDNRTICKLREAIRRGQEEYYE